MRVLKCLGILLIISGPTMAQWEIKLEEDWKLWAGEGLEQSKPRTSSQELDDDSDLDWGNQTTVEPPHTTEEHTTEQTSPSTPKMTTTTTPATQPPKTTSTSTATTSSSSSSSSTTSTTTMTTTTLGYSETLTATFSDEGTKWKPDFADKSSEAFKRQAEIYEKSIHEVFSAVKKSYEVNQVDITKLTEKKSTEYSRSRFSEISLSESASTTDVHFEARVQSPSNGDLPPEGDLKRDFAAGVNSTKKNYANFSGSVTRTTTSSPTTKPTTTPKSNSTTKKLAIAGIVLACLAFVAMVVAIAVLFLFSRRTDRGGMNNFDAL